MSNPLSADGVDGPLYKRVYQELLREFQAEERAGSAKLPSENELCERYRTSRRTVRMAVDLLIEQGLVQRLPGKGTFVVDPARRTAERTNHNIVLFWPEMELPDGELLSLARISSGLRTVFSPDSSIVHQTLPDNVSAFDELSNRLVGQVDGLVIVSPPKEVQKLLRNQPVPLVVSGHLLPQIDLPYVCFNLFRMGYEASHEILKRGHRRFASICPDLDNTGAQRFQAGVHQALLDLHLPLRAALQRAAKHPNEHFQAVDEVVADGASCIILLEPEYAGPIHHYLLNHGIRVPEDVSLVILEMFKNMTIQPPFYSGFPADRLGYGVKCGELLLRLMKREPLRSSDLHVVVNLDFYEGKTLQDLSSSSSATTEKAPEE